jgi:hypothetical protein
VIGVSTELAYLLLFSLALLVRFLWQRRGKVHRWEEALARTPLPDVEPPADAKQPVPTAAAPVRPSSDWLPAERPPADRYPTRTGIRPDRPQPAPARAGVAAQQPTARRPRRFSRQSLFGDRRRTQDAMVAAAILGPCRSDSPHDSGR